jgi:aminoglycoside N3'-acetyltransferase
VFELTSDLHRLGVAAGDVLMVHASLRALGPVEDGAAGVVAALDNAVAASGTLLMVLGARDDWDWVNTHPENERTLLLAAAPVFDKDNTPADPDVGGCQRFAGSAAWTTLRESWTGLERTTSPSSCGTTCGRDGPGPAE